MVTDRPAFPASLSLAASVLCPLPAVPLSLCRLSSPAVGPSPAAADPLSAWGDFSAVSSAGSPPPRIARSGKPPQNSGSFIPSIKNYTDIFSEIPCGCWDFRKCRYSFFVGISRAIRFHSAQVPVPCILVLLYRAGHSFSEQGLAQQPVYGIRPVGVPVLRLCPALLWPGNPVSQAVAPQRMTPSGRRVLHWAYFKLRPSAA